MSSGVSRDELYALLARAGERVSVSAGEVIFEKGERGDQMYVVRDGS